MMPVQYQPAASLHFVILSIQPSVLLITYHLIHLTRDCQLGNPRMSIISWPWLVVPTEAPGSYHENDKKTGFRGRVS